MNFFLGTLPTFTSVKCPACQYDIYIGNVRSEFICESCGSQLTSNYCYVYWSALAAFGFISIAWLAFRYVKGAEIFHVTTLLPLAAAYYVIFLMAEVRIEIEKS